MVLVGVGMRSGADMLELRDSCFDERVFSVPFEHHRRFPTTTPFYQRVAYRVLIFMSP